MSAVLNPVPATKPVPMTAWIVGKIKAARSFDGRHYTQVVIPAPDAYSHPGVVEVRSKQRLGSVGDELQELCRVSGFPRKSFVTKDGRQVDPVEITLDRVE